MGTIRHGWELLDMDGIIGDSFKVAPKKTKKESYKNLCEDPQKENIKPHKHTSEASI